jgi:hypothetical protein
MMVMVVVGVGGWHVCNVVVDVVVVVSHTVLACAVSALRDGRAGSPQVSLPQGPRASGSGSIGVR